MPRSVPPTRCLESHPTKQSIRFGGRYINLSLIARDQKIDQSALSRIFAGKRRPHIDHARKIARALGLSLDDFLTTLDHHIAGRAPKA